MLPGWLMGVQQSKPQMGEPHTLRVRPLAPWVLISWFSQQKTSLNTEIPVCSQVTFPGNSIYISLHKCTHSTQP